jgi:hypothetical protein
VHTCINILKKNKKFNKCRYHSCYWYPDRGIRSCYIEAKQVVECMRFFNRLPDCFEPLCGGGI